MKGPSLRRHRAPSPRFLGGQLVRSGTALLLGGSLAAQNLVVRNYSELDGLPSPDVRDVREGPSGLMWFATDEGLFEYDGTSWLPVLEDVVPAGTDVAFLRFDDEGSPWLLCEDRVLDAGPRGRRPEADRGVPGELVDFDVLGGEHALVALSTSERGLRLWSESDGWRGPGPGLSAGEHPPCVEVSLGCLFAGCAEGLFVREGERWRRLPGTPGAVRGLGSDGSAGEPRLWVAGNGWLGSVMREEGELRFRVEQEGLPSLDEVDEHRPLVVSGDGRGGAVYGASWTIVQAGVGGHRIFDRGSGIVSDGAASLWLDASGFLWGGSKVGAFKILGFDVVTWDREQGLFEDGVTAVAELPDGRMALGHFGGLSVLEADGPPRRITFPEVKPQSRILGRVMDLLADGSGRLWLASGLGLGLLEEERVRWIPLPVGRWANALHEDLDGTLLVGGDQGIFRLVGERLVHERGGLFVRRLEVGRDGTLYAATPLGVYVERDGEARILRSPASPEPGTADHFFTVFEDRDGDVWCGRADGLWRIADGALQLARPVWSEGRAVYSLTEDTRGRLWVGTDLGLAYLDASGPTSLAWLVGYTGTESNRGAAFVDRSGAVWMGTNGGVARFAPGFEIPRGAPALCLTEIRAEGEVRPLDRPVRIRTGRSDLAIRVRARPPFAEDRVVFRSRVEGFTDWEEAEGPTVHEARYTGLPPGRYRFEAQVRGPGGVFGPSARSPWIEVAGPPWTRWWFLAGMLAMSSLATFALQRAVLRRRQTRLLRSEVEARTRELQASLEELAKTDRLRALGTLAAGIAHDLRNVLTIIDGNLSILRERSTDDAGSRACFEAADQAVERATQLSSQLQTFATGGSPLTRSISLETLLRECGELVLAGSRVRLEQDLAEGLWPVEADQAQIRQVFENLLINARQCQGGEGRVRITGANRVLEEPTAGGARPGRFVQVCVSDDGPGIPGAVVPQIFDPFFTTRSQGTGLGLATALSIVRRHGGELRLLATSPRGTTFCVLLPAAERAPSRERPARRPAARAPAPAAGTRRVLVVDDEPQIRRLLATMLERLGIEALAAADGEEACRLLAAARADGRPVRHAIVDVQLSAGETGSRVLERLRALEPELRAAASSGYSADSVLAHPGEHGFLVALPKPYRLQELRRVLRALGLEGEPGESRSPDPVAAAPRSPGT